MSEYVGTISLRNKRRVYRDGREFRVVHIDSKEVEHIYRIPVAAAERLYTLSRGTTISADDAANRIRPFASKLGLQFDYGWKLGHLAREICVVLATTGRASLVREGRRFLFRVL